MAEATDLEVLAAMEDLGLNPEPPIEESEEYKLFFDYNKAKPRVTGVIDSWSEESENSKQRRKERYVELDVDQLRANGDLEEDETLCPVRIIDTNIMREKPELMGFLKGGDRLAAFRPLSNPSLDTQRLEEDFTQGLTYPGWYLEFERLVDGAALHGSDALEVVYDQSKPLHVAFEHVGHDRLYYNREVFNIQDSEYLIRRFDLSLMRLKSFVNTFGFDADQVNLITQDEESAKNAPNRVLCVYRVYYKFNNCVYVTWFTKESKATNWLKAPEKLAIGIQQKQMVEIPPAFDPITGLEIPQAPTEEWNDVELDMYPVFLYVYREDENEKLVEKKGRAFLDSPIQEAATAINSALVNSTMRASNLYASPKTDDGENAEMKMLDVKLQHGLITSRPMEFYNTPFPDPMMFGVLQNLSSQSANETGKTSFAVMNRKDSRKTAKELEAAEQAQGMMSSTVIASFSETLRSVYSFAWRIIKSQALQNKVRFILIEQPDALGQVSYVNDQSVIDGIYDIRAAGDIDVVQRGQLLQLMKQDWPVISTIPGLSEIFMKDLIRLSYPKRAKEYLLAIERGDMATNIINSLMSIAQGAIQPEEWKALGAEKQQQLQMLFQQAQQYVAMKSGQQPPQ